MAYFPGYMVSGVCIYSSRRKPERGVRQVQNLLIVWLMTGIWHGASWNFALWGLYYGILLIGEKILFGNYLKKAPALLCHIYCMFLVMVGWNLFVFEDIGEGIRFLKSLFGFYRQGPFNRETIYLLYNHGILLVLCILGCTKVPGRIGERICRVFQNRMMVLMAMKYAGYMILFFLSVAWLVDATFNPFLYFRF